MPTIGHVVYIPGVLLLGFAFGFAYGAKAARKELERQRELRKK